MPELGTEPMMNSNPFLRAACAAALLLPAVPGQDKPVHESATPAQKLLEVARELQRTGHEDVAAVIRAQASRLLLDEGPKVQAAAPGRESAKGAPAAASVRQPMRLVAGLPPQSPRRSILVVPREGLERYDRLEVPPEDAAVVDISRKRFRYVPTRVATDGRGDVTWVGLPSRRAEQAPAGQTPAGQTPAAQTPTQQAPTQQAPTQQAPTQQAPAQQATAGPDPMLRAKVRALGEEVARLRAELTEIRRALQEKERARLIR
ncbi:MAG: hypothetical protein H6836_03040 [Planctomycetes bacterium]|nr:hypothetical protein [Planctomycetota bacterium]